MAQLLCIPTSNGTELVAFADGEYVKNGTSRRFESLSPGHWAAKHFLTCSLHLGELGSLLMSSHFGTCSFSALVYCSLFHVMCFVCSFVIPIYS